MSFESSGDDQKGLSLVDRISFILTEHRGLAYVTGAIVTLWMAGYVIDMFAGPYSESTRLAHVVSGLLGTAAIVFVLCGLVVAVLWGVLLLVTRLRNGR